ncbi:hypothetical protein, partial [Thermocrinis sp.]|uniref:hypothetical protein n=1 Tax=Thermocrinis sp. TaxID=2024383 RepID=UPI003BFC4635
KSTVSIPHGGLRTEIDKEIVILKVDVSIEDFFVFKGENLLTYYADEVAKFYLRGYKEYANKTNPWRYRL